MHNYSFYFQTKLRNPSKPSRRRCVSSRKVKLSSFKSRHSGHSFVLTFYSWSLVLSISPRDNIKTDLSQINDNLNEKNNQNVLIQIVTTWDLPKFEPVKHNFTTAILHIPYTRHYNPRLVYILTQFWSPFLCFKGFFQISIKEQFVIKSGLWWCLYGN